MIWLGSRTWKHRRSEHLFQDQKWHDIEMGEVPERYSDADQFFLADHLITLLFSNRKIILRFICAAGEVPRETLRYTHVNKTKDIMWLTRTWHRHAISPWKSSIPAAWPQVDDSGFCAVITRKSNSGCASLCCTAFRTPAFRIVTSSGDHFKTSWKSAAVKASTPSVKLILINVPISFNLGSFGQLPMGSLNFCSFILMNPALLSHSFINGAGSIVRPIFSHASIRTMNKISLLKCDTVCKQKDKRLLLSFEAVACKVYSLLRERRIRRLYVLQITNLHSVGG